MDGELDGFAAGRGDAQGGGDLHSKAACGVRLAKTGKGCGGNEQAKERAGWEKAR
jgi:hypothetical protein